MLFLVFAVVLGGQTLYRKFTGTALDGFTTVILVLLITGSAIMIGLGVIGTYLARIYEEVKARPRYVVAETVGEPPAGSA
jgi:polyisoprenyl-phosphate glycosyltransferase